MTAEGESSATTPQQLPGVSAMALTIAGSVPAILGLGIGLVSIPLRYGPLLHLPGLFSGLLIVGGASLVLAAFLIGLSRLKARKELAAGYTTFEGHPEVPRLDRKTGAILRKPGEPEPTYKQILAIRERSRKE
jgi:hypothetical protein